MIALRYAYSFFFGTCANIYCLPGTTGQSLARQLFNPNY